MAAPTTTVSLQNALDASAAIMSSADKKLADAISSMTGTPTSADLIALQQQFQVWSLAVSTITSMNKEMADTLKSIPAKF